MRDQLLEYLYAGFALTPIPVNAKGPRIPGWNLRANAVTSAEQLPRDGNVGLLHAYCTPTPTCALDVDDFQAAAEWLAQRGCDLAGLMAADDAVQIRSGRENRAKLLYRLPGGVAALPSRKIVAAGAVLFELRCADVAGNSLQDVLPPSIHPDTGRPYEWGGAGRFDALPELPAALLALWHSLIALDVRVQSPTLGEVTLASETVADLRSALLSMRADDRDLWVRMGMALKEAGEAGRGLWLEWSQTSPKFDPFVAAQQWNSFTPTQTGINAVFAEARRNGWQGRLGAQVDPFVFDSSAEPAANAAPGAVFGSLPFTIGSQGFDRPLSWLVRRFIPADSFGYLYGASGSFKTFLALDLCCHIATGRPWHGAKVKRGAVLYFAGEGAHGVRLRIKAWELDKGETVSAVAVVSQGVPMNEPQAVAQAIDTVRTATAQLGEPVALVVFDTLARCFSGEENANSDMGRFVAGCDELRRVTGASVLVVHHNGKDEGKGARGATALRGAADFEFAIRRTDADVLMQCEKLKDGEAPPDKRFHSRRVDLHMVDDEGEPVTSLVMVSQDGAVVDDTQTRAVEALRICLAKGWHVGGGRNALDRQVAQLPEATRKAFEIQGDLKWLNGALARAEAAGLVRRVSIGRNKAGDPQHTAAPTDFFRFGAVLLSGGPKPGSLFVWHSDWRALPDWARGLDGFHSLPFACR